MAESLVNGDAENTVQTALLTVVNAAGILEANFDTSTDVEGEDPEKVKRKSHHAEIEKRRKSKLNEGINKLIEILPDRDAKRSKVQILEDTYNLVVELQKKCNQLMIQNAPESEVDEIKRLMEENAKLKKEKEDWTEFFRSMNINTDIRTHMKAVLQSKSKRNSKLEPPSDQLLGGSQNIIIQSPTNTVMGSPNLMTMPTNQMTIPIASGNRLDGNVLQAGTNPGGMLLVTTSRAGRDSQQTLTLTNNQIGMVSNERPEAEGQSPLPKAIGEVVENQSVPASSQEGTAIAAITCTHEASNQNAMGPVNTTTAESKNTTAVTQVISTPITTPASQNQVLMQSGTGGVRLVQQQPVQSQSQTVLIQLPGQPGQFIPVRIAPQVNQPQQVILTSQQGVNVIGTRGSAIQPKTPVKKKQPPQLKVKNLCPLQPDSRKPNSPIASQSSVQPIAPNTVTVRLPMNPTANQQQSTVMMNNQGQLILQQPSNTVLSSGMNMQMPVQVVPKPQVTQNIVYIQQNGQLIPVILQQNQGNVQQGVQQQTGAIIQGQQQPQQQTVKMQASQNLTSRPMQSTAATMQSSASAPVVVSSGISQSAPSISSQALDGTSIPASSSSQVVSNSYQVNDLMNPLAIETQATQSDQGRMQGASGFAANDILAKATESIFSQSETSPMQLGDLHDSQAHTANQSVIKNANGLFSHQTTQPGIEIYDLPDDMDVSSSKSKHKKKKKKKSKSKEKEKKKKNKDKEKSKKINFPLPTVASTDNNADVSDVQEMATSTEALIESLMQGTLGTGGINHRNNADSVMKIPTSTSLASDIPVSANGSVQMSSFSAEALLSSGTRDNLAGSQREGTQVSSASISTSEANGQAIFSAFNSMNFGADILSNSMSVSGLPTYIDDEEEMVSGNTSTEGPPSITSTANEDTSTSLSVVTSSNCTQNQPGNSLSLTFSHGTDRMIPPEQKTPDSSKVATTPTSDSFHSFMSPPSFPSISSLLEQSSNAEREASISSLPPSSQKDDSPTNGLTGVTGGPFQHSWISHHSKASELARGIQPGKSQSPVSMPTLISTTSTTLSTSASMAVSTIPSVNMSPSSILQATNPCNANKSSPSLNLLSQPWLNASTAETLPDATSQPDLANANLRQQQQLADLLQGLSGPKASSSQANTEVLTSTGDVLSSLPKSQPSLESLFGLPPFNETRPTSQSNGDLFQSIASIIDSNKTRTTPNSRDNFPGLPPYSVQTTSSSSVPAMEQNTGFREPALEQTKEISSNNSTKPINAPPSYSLMNRVSAVVDKYKEKKVPSASQNIPKVPDTCDVESNPTSEQVFQNVSQQQSIPVAEVGPISSSNQSRYLHPKSRALASAAVQVSPPTVQANNNIITAQTNPPATQARQRTGNQKNSNQKKLPVKTFSTATIHRTLTADISEEGGPGTEQVDEPVVQVQPETVKDAPQEQMPFCTVQEPQQHLQQAIVQQVIPSEVPVQQPPAKSKSSKGSKKRQKEKQQLERPKPPEEDLDSVGRRELDKNLINRFPWLAEANGKPAGKQAGGLSQHTSNTNPTAFSVQSISQSSSKNPPPKARGGASRAELSQNPPPYPSRTPTVSGDSHNQPLWNPSSLDSNVQISSSSSMIPPKLTAQDRNQRHLHQGSADLSQQSSSIDTTIQNRQSTGNNRPAAFQASSSNYVQAAVNAAVSKAAQQALLAKGMTGHSSVPEKNRNVSTTKKTSHRPKSGGSSQILKQSDIDDGLDFLNSASNSSTFPTSLSSMDMFDNASVSSSLISRQVDQSSQRSGGSRSRATDKPGRVESSHPSTLLQNDFATVSQDNFSFTQWNLEPQQTEDRESTRGNSHKMQELASPPMQQIQQRGGNNCVNVNFGETPNLGSGDDLDFSNLPSFQSSNQQQQHTPTDRQTPQNQTYSVPSGRSSVASMEPSPHQASPMNYNVQEGSHISQMNEMPHSNSSSRGPPSVEAPSQQQQPHQQRRMTHSPMIQSGHPGQGIKRAATDGHHMNVAKKAHGGMHPGRRATPQSNLEPRQHSSIHTNHQSQVHSNAMQFQPSTAHTPNQSSESIYVGGEVQRIMYPSQSGVRIQDGSRSKKRTQNPSDSIFARDPHEVDGTRSTSISLLQDSWLGGSTRMNTSSSNEAAPPTFLPNFSSSQTSQSQSESVPSSSSSSSLISNISPSRRLRHSEMPTYLPSHLPGPILPSPPQTKGSHTREAADITASFNPMYTPSRTAGIHSVGMAANFPVFHEHQPPGGFNIVKSNQGVTPPFNFNNIFNDSSQMTSSSHASEAATLNHSIGLTPTVHLHGNASEESVLHGNMGQRHAGQHFGLLAQNRPSDVRAQFKMGVPTPMGMPQHFHSPSFMPPY